MSGIPGTLHLYIYALNNPVLYNDPSGEVIPFIVIAIAAGISGGIVGGLGYYGLQYYFSDDPCARWDWYQAAFWSGAGAVIGAAGVATFFGGWWVGVQLGWWGRVSTGVYTVYWYLENEVPKYFGQTNQFLLRAQAHVEQRGWIVKPISGLTRLCKFDARAVEQTLIEHYGLENLYNKVNSISPNNPIYSQALSRGKEILSLIGFYM